jgi:hypothetical protein
MKTIQNKVKELIYLDLSELNPFQGNLKDLSKENYNKLRKQILGGFKAPFFVWLDPSTNKYMLEDGHQRYRVLTELKNAEKYTLPKLPCVVIQADSEHEAKKNILEISSQFGNMSSQSLFEFASLNNIDLPTLEDFRFPEINIDAFKAEFFDMPIESDKEGAQELDESDFQEFEHECPKCGFCYDSPK